MKRLLMLAAILILLATPATATDVALLNTAVFGMDASSPLPSLLAPHSATAVLPSHMELHMVGSRIDHATVSYGDNIDEGALVEELSKKYGNPIRPYVPSERKMPIWQMKDDFRVRLLSAGKGGIVFYFRKQ